MKIAADITRCADALDRGCPDRKHCARWVLRHHNSTMSTPWLNFAQCRTDDGCKAIIKMETSDENYA